jgi:hypothetical protein
MVLVNQIVEMNAFVLKAIFEIPSPHVINIMRLCFWGVVCLPAIRQTYAYSAYILSLQEKKEEHFPYLRVWYGWSRLSLKTFVREYVFVKKKVSGP